MTRASEEEIDIVIAWVDGNDPLLKQKRESYKNQQRQASNAIAATRFASNNEIYYNIASILKYVPFCRYIYIVTDQQKPELIYELVEQNICPTDKIRIIDHKDIFSSYEQFLPTFNTRSIETMLWNIPNLSNYFIYMNDDFFFNQPAKLKDFLDRNSIVLYGHWRHNATLQVKLDYRQALYKLTGKAIQPKHTTAQMLSSKVIGMTKFFEIHHYPHIVDKHILKKYLLCNRQSLINQIKYKFRDVAQFNPITLMNHLKIQQNEACLKPPIALNYLKNAQGIDNFIAALQDKTIKYGCIQSLDMLDHHACEQISAAMNQKFANYLPASLLATSDV